MVVIEEKGLESLLVWQKSLQFALYISRQVIPMLPDAEKYALTSQIRRACQSIPANIAEGYGRFYYQEGIRFAYIARGSLEETRSHLTFAHEMDYLTSDDYSKLRTMIAEIRKLINGYINYLKRTKQGIGEPGIHYFTSTNENNSVEDQFVSE